MGQANHALVVGASSGIGRAMAHEVAPFVTKLTLASRSCPDDLIPSIKGRNPSIDITHEKLDVSSLREVRQFTDKHKNATFDWIIHDHLRLIPDTQPPLINNNLAATTGGKPDVDDLDLKQTYSIKRCADYTVTYSDLMAQAFSEKAPQASFMHATPGVVATSLANNLPWYARIPAKCLTPLIARTPEDCAKSMVSALTKDEFSSGWYLVSKDGEALQTTKFQTEEMKEIVWKHSVSTIEQVLQQAE